MYKEYLNEVYFNVDFSGMKLKDIKDCGKGCDGQIQINNRQYGEKIVYGFVEISFNDNDK